MDGQIKNPLGIRRKTAPMIVRSSGRDGNWLISSPYHITMNYRLKI